MPNNYAARRCHVIDDRHLIGIQTRCGQSSIWGNPGRFGGYAKKTAPLVNFLTPSAKFLLNINTDKIWLTLPYDVAINDIVGCVMFGNSIGETCRKMRANVCMLRGKPNTFTWGMLCLQKTGTARFPNWRLMLRWNGNNGFGKLLHNANSSACNLLGLIPLTLQSMP